jgi:uncharacterized DUF497 family protein
MFSRRQLIPYPASQEILYKLDRQHDVDWEEVEEVFRGKPRMFRLEIDHYGERRYLALGQTDAGRYLSVIFVFDVPNKAKVITARDMTIRERRRYRRR